MATILIAGGTGLVGLHLSRQLRGEGHTVLHLSRRANLSAEFPAYAWHIGNRTLDIAAFQKADFIINLAGSGIADKRWSAARKRDIIESRTQSTALLAHYLATEKHHVKAYISASAIGYYGERGDALMTETAPVGQGFLAESTAAWEQAIDQVRATDVRTVALRIGIVLSTRGGALAKMLIPFWFRMGVYFGNGAQWYAWIHIDDVCRMFGWAMENTTAIGTYNAVAPTPLSNHALTKAIATAKGGLHVLLPAPAFILRLAMGEMADVVLNSTKVSAEKIEKAGFQFRFREAVPALRDLFLRKV